MCVVEVMVIELPQQIVQRVHHDREVHQQAMISQAQELVGLQWNVALWMLLW